MKHAKFVSFTAVGARTAAKAAALLPDFLTERYARTVDPSLAGTSLSRFAQQAMVDCDLIVFVGAVGIAVRAVAPYLAGKAYDPAVIVIDEAGKFVIPVLSGHLGGANALAERLADGLGAQAVVTTATDGRDVFAVDNWARDNGCAVLDPPHIKHVSGALLRGETVGVRSDFPVDGRLPAHISLNADAESGFVIGFDTKAAPFAHTLHLVPRIVYAGVSCRRGTDADKIESAVQEALTAAGVPRRRSAARRALHQERRAGAAAVLRNARPRADHLFGGNAAQAAGDFTRPPLSRRLWGWITYASARRCARRAAAGCSGARPRGTA